MPVAGKLFLYNKPLDLKTIHDKLEGYNVEDTLKLDQSYTIGKRVYGLELSSEQLMGEYAQDGIKEFEYRGEVSYAPFTVRSTFYFKLIDKEPYLIIIAGKKIANKVALDLSHILEGAVGIITEPVLNIMKFKELYEKGGEAKITLFDNVTIPSVEKGTLYGVDLIQTDMYNRFVNVGTPWYVVFKDQRYGITVGIVRDGAICSFSGISKEEYIEYVINRVIPVILRSRGD